MLVHVVRNGLHMNPSSTMSRLFHQQSDRMSDEFRKSNGGLMAPDGSELYVFGIIDYLQKYNRRKKLANFAKSLKGDKVRGPS